MLFSRMGIVLSGRPKPPSEERASAGPSQVLGHSRLFTDDCARRLRNLPNKAL
jgi:hypothetical protein